jgi:hypothetical protein
MSTMKIGILLWEFCGTHSGARLPAGLARGWPSYPAFSDAGHFGLAPFDRVLTNTRLEEAHGSGLASQTMVWTT